MGLSHKTAPVSVRERLSFTREQVCVINAGLRSVPGLDEGFVLSTCNRTEILAALRPDTVLDRAIHEIMDYLAATGTLDRTDLNQYMYAHNNLEAVRHLFRVASSLDSMVVGEPQILGQVKEAYNLGVQTGSLGHRLDGLMQRAFSVAKRIRASTSISRNPVSISYAAVELAGRIFGSLNGRSVMLLGAGKMADLASKHLINAGARSVFVASRTFHHAQEVAARYNGVPITIDRFLEYMTRVDIVISSTAAPHYILRKEEGQAVMKERRGRPLFVIDIAVPRDIDPELNKIDNLYLYDIDALQGVVDAGLEERRREAVTAEAIVEEEVTGFHARSRAREAAPAIVLLRERLHAVADSEMQRFRGKLGPLSEKQEEGMREMMASLVNKILHGPTRELKNAGGRAGGDDAIDLVTRMFDLEDADNSVEKPVSREDGGTRR